jgi:uncharacterized protein YdeI (BOF family)
MKRFLIVLALVLFATQAIAAPSGKWLNTAAQTAAANYVATGNAFTWVAMSPESTPPSTYDAAYTNTATCKVRKTVTGDAFTVGSDGAGGIRVTLAAQTGITGASEIVDTGTVTHQCVVNTSNSTLIACVPLTTARAIAANTEIWDSASTYLDFKAITTP